MMTKFDIAKGVPTFLQQYLMTSIFERLREAGYMANWLRVHAHIRKLPHDTGGLSVLANMMAVEYHREGGPRMDIIVRLHGKFQRMRYELERVQLGARK